MTQIAAFFFEIEAEKALQAHQVLPWAILSKAAFFSPPKKGPDRDPVVWLEREPFPFFLWHYVSDSTEREAWRGFINE